MNISESDKAKSSYTTLKKLKQSCVMENAREEWEKLHVGAQRVL